MTAPPDDTTTDLHIALAALRAERDAALSEKAELTEALATRNSEYGERIEQQAATIDVLKAMSASPGDARPVFELIVERAHSFCGADHATAALLQDDMLHLQAHSGMSAAYGADYAAQFPRPVDTSTMFGRAILSRDVMQTGNLRADRDHFARQMHTADFHSIVAVPIFREGTPIGAIALGQYASGGFTDTQIELLKTFAEQAVIAITSAETYRALQERTAALATRNSEYGERIEHQAATIDVLKVMSASPGDPQPAFELIVRRARELCNSAGAGIAEYDGVLVHQRSLYGDSSGFSAEYIASFPMRLTRGSIPCRAILDKRIIHIRNMDIEPELLPIVRHLRVRSVLSIPLLRDGAAVGAFTIHANQSGGFSDSQIELLKTFAEQAVIAITSAETYRALQTRTSDLQQSLEYQTATSDMLNVISRSTFDLQPVLDTVVETAARLCDADQVAVARPEGDFWRLAANFGFPAEYEAYYRATGIMPYGPDPSVTARAVREKVPVHIHDVAAIPGYPDLPIRLGKQRTSLAVPLLREGQSIGVILLGRQRVAPFTDRQIELVRTFADQAVIAIENTRLITEQQEALERQTAMAEVLAVINAHPGELGPVFDMILEKAHILCDIGMGALLTCEAGQYRAVATRGYSPEADAHARSLRPIPDNLAALAKSGAVRHHPDVSRADSPLSNTAFGRTLIALTGARTFLVVPLSREGTLLGFITAVRREVRPFTERQIALLKNFAAQAVIAMENARLITEQREALEQQTATAEVLQVINANPGNLTPVFDAILDKAHTLCGAAIGSLMLFDGTYFRAMATHGWPNSIAALFSEPAGPNRARQRLVDGERFVQVADIRAIGRGPNSAWGDAVVESTDARTMLLVPLRKDGALLGFISAFRPEVRVFSDKEITLLENFAAQAVIAMENARLLTEQREALEQQTATAQVLQIINSSPGNLTPVFDAMLEKAMRLCEAPFGSLYTYDGESFRSAAQRGVPLAYAEFRARNPPTLVPGSGMETLVTTKRTFHVLDVKARDHYRAGEPGARAMVDLGGIRTLLSVRLVKDDALVGIFSIYRQEVRAFSDRQIELLENFAAQAVIAMENARLLTEQREALEQQTATAEVLQVINASPGNLAPVFDAMLEKAIRLCEAEFGTLRTWDGERFHLGAAHGDPRLIEWTRRHGPFTPDGDAPLARIVSGAEVVRITDDQLAAYQTSSGFGAMAAAIGFRSGITLALRKDATLLGTITVYRKNEVRPFTDKQVALLQNFAAQAVIAMENARLLEEIRQRQAELRVTFDNMGDGVVMFDAEHHLAAWNRNFQQLLDVPDAMLAERPSYADYLSLLAEQGEFGTDDVEAELARRLGDTDRELRLERTRPDGRVIEVRRNAVPGGGFVLIYSDITERKRSEEEIRAARDAAETALRELRTAQANLIQAEKMASLGQLTAGIAHEIKNPLNFVNNFAALSVDLLDELKETAAPGFAALTEKQRAEVEEVSVMLTSNLEKITEHGKRADAIVKAMLEHSRGSSGERRMVDLNALIDEALNLAYHGARAQDQSFNITLERDFGAGIAPIEVNPQDITRVFLNLFANGFYATTKRARDGGDAGLVPTLKVATRDVSEAVEIRVRDNGTGIPADIRDKLFQPFFTTKPTGEGTGLGLSITYDIVTQQHGGSIAVDSKVGDFSEFAIRLPRSP